MSGVMEVIESLSTDAQTEPLPFPWVFLAISLPIALLAAWGIWLIFNKAYRDRSEIQFGVGAIEGMMAAFCVLVVMALVGKLVILLLIPDPLAHQALLKIGDVEAYTNEHLAGILRAAATVLVLLATISIYARKREGEKFPIFAPPVARRDLWLIAAIAAWWLLMFGMTFFNLSLVTIIAPDFVPVEQAVASAYRVETPFRVAAAVMGAVVLAPISEEFMFRLFFFGGLRKRLPFFAAALLTSVVFLVIHEPWKTPQIILPVFGLGFTLAWIYERTRNIWYPIAFHAMHNLVTLALMGVLS